MKIKILIAFSYLLATSPTYAGQFDGCTVIEIVSAGDHNVHVQLSCNMSRPPPCAIALPYMGFDGATAEGKRYFALVSMAFSINMKLTGTIDDVVCAPHQRNVALLTSLRLTK
jgi:hypothetical protein